MGIQVSIPNPLTVDRGGIGVATLGDAGVLIGNGTGAVQVTGAGTSGQVLTSNGAGVDPTFQAAAAAAATPKVIWNYKFTGATSGAADSNENIEKNVTAAATATFSNSGASLDTSATITNGVLLEVPLSTSTNFAGYAGSPSFTTALRFGGSVGTDLNIRVGISDGVLTGGAITYTRNNIGFKIIRASSGTSDLYATQANGTTETASASLTTLAANDFLDLILQVNSTTSVDYYWRKNGGALSSATNLTTNMPTITTDDELSWQISNVGVATSTTMNIASATYSR